MSPDFYAIELKRDNKGRTESSQEFLKAYELQDTEFGPDAPFNFYIATPLGIDTIIFRPEDNQDLINFIYNFEEAAQEGTWEFQITSCVDRR